MLVLTRKIGDGIDIGSCIKVTVIAMRGNQVKLGIEAPAEISVYRSEITARIIEENRKAATSLHLDKAALQTFWRQENETRSL